MDDSPRSTKRRKLDTTMRKSSRSLLRAPPQSATNSPDTTKQPLASAVEVSEDVICSLPTAKPSRKALRGAKDTPKNTPRRRTATVDNVNIYDDLEGALGEEAIAQRPRWSLKEARNEYSPIDSATKTSPSKRNGSIVGVDRGKANIEKTQAAKTPKRPRLSKASDKLDSSRRQRLGILANEYSHEEDARTESEDELALTLTPSSHRKSRINGLTSSVRGNGRDSKKLIELVDQEAEAESNYTGLNGSYWSVDVESRTPRKNTGRRSRTQAVKLAAIPRNEKDSESSLSSASRHDAANAMQKRKATPGKRSISRTDYFDNEDEYTANKLRAEGVEGSKDTASGVDFVPTAHRIEEDEPTEGPGGVIEETASAHEGSVLDPLEPSPFNSNKKHAGTATPSGFHSINGELGSIHSVELLKKIVVERITGKRPAPLVGLDNEYLKVHQLLEHTIIAGEGNSMLLIGARGSGKTALVNNVIADLSRDHRDDFYIVKLNGCIHTDDKIALREIWRQLGKEMEVEEDGLGKNYADTLTTLLALLSHPSEQSGEDSEQIARAVIFVMDEFDLFASHPRQTLLYNLFDIAQSRKAPIAALGLTTRIDVSDSLEKRVKSRFSHRYVHLSLAKTFSAFQEICKASLIVQTNQLSVEERAMFCAPLTSTPSKNSKKSSRGQNLLAEWNSNISSLFTSRPFLQNHLAPQYHLTKSAPTILTNFLLPVLTLGLSPSSAPLQPLLNPPDSKLPLLSSLSYVQLSLLISAARLDIILDTDTCNFNMAYDEYVKLASRARIQSAAGGAVASGSATKVWGKEVARREWERLVEWQLLIPVGSERMGKGEMIKVDVALEEIVGAVEAGGEKIDRVLERWCKQI